MTSNKRNSLVESHFLSYPTQLAISFPWSVFLLGSQEPVFAVFCVPCVLLVSDVGIAVLQGWAAGSVLFCIWWPGITPQLSVPLCAGACHIHFPAQVSFMELRTSSSLLDKSPWINHTPHKLKISKLNPHSSSKPVFLMVSPVSKNRTRSLVLRFKHWGSSSPFFFYSHFTFIWWQITLTLPSVHVLEPPIGRYPLCPSHIALAWMMAMTLTGFHISPPPSCCPLCKSSLLTASRQPRIHSEYEADLACLQAVGSLLPFSLPLALTRDLCWGVALPTHLCPGTPWSPSLPKCSPCPYHKWTCCMHKLVSLWKAQEGWACFIFFVGFLGIFGPQRDLQCL